MYAFIFIDTEPGVFIIVKKFSLLLILTTADFIIIKQYGKAKVFEERGKSSHSLKPPKGGR